MRCGSSSGNISAARSRHDRWRSRENGRMQEGRFDGRVAIITGGGSGIGQATARGFVRDGGYAVIIELEPDRAVETVKSLDDRGVAVIGDLTDPAIADDAVAAAERLGGVDVLVNCAGF